MINKREGGVATVRNGDLFCLNCKIENEHFDNQQMNFIVDLIELIPF